MAAALLLLLLAAALPAQDATTHLEAGECALCHTRIRTPQIGQHPLWKNSMMARAGRDPYWRMRVERERGLLPSAHALIGDKCFRCHTPARADLGEPAAANEGVTCTVCHRIAADNFGAKASFTGGFTLSAKKELHGPHERPFQMPMLMHTAMAPVHAAHVVKPELCATCHTVITPILDRQGNTRGEFYEQTPYLEWLASDGGETSLTCQQCHMPALDEPEYIAHRPPGGPFPPTRPRKPFARHEFSGGNAQMLARTGGAAERTVAQLESALSLETGVRVDRAQPVLEVTVRNQTGHKLPTGFPGRRLWLHVAAFDAGGKRLFESGGPGADFLQPHRTDIHSSAETMVWEARLSGPSLLLDAAWAKDNRILPAGYREEKIGIPGIDAAKLRPVGVQHDGDFLPGQDTVRYHLPRGAARATVRALFLSAPEMGEDPPVVLAETSVTLPPAK